MLELDDELGDGVELLDLLVPSRPERVERRLVEGEEGELLHVRVMLDVIGHV
jgi:hypothetical protein